LGAAIIAGVGVGVFENFAAGARQMVRAHAIIEPDADNHSRYRAMYSIYRDLYESARPLYERLGAVT
jgi:L-xylulokinase